VAATGNAFARSEALRADVEAVAAVDDVRVPAIAEWFAYLGLGIALGILFVKSQVLSWYRIQEMFRFQSFHMYGVIATAIATAAIVLLAIRAADARTLKGDRITIPPKDCSDYATRFWLGGSVFGLGWALLGACPGPMFTLIGTGSTVLIVPLAAAVGGTAAYGYARNHLPH
jgi:uncharacterized membrane protein YedE/YeeE